MARDQYRPAGRGGAGNYAPAPAPAVGGTSQPGIHVDMAIPAPSSGPDTPLTQAPCAAIASSSGFALPPSQPPSSSSLSSSRRCVSGRGGAGNVSRATEDAAVKGQQQPPPSPPQVRAAYVPLAAAVRFIAGRGGAGNYAADATARKEGGRREDRARRDEADLIAVRDVDAELAVPPPIYRSGGKAND